MMKNVNLTDLSNMVVESLNLILSENASQEAITSRRMIPKVRGGWNEKKIINYIKHNSSYRDTMTAIKEIAEFDNVNELRDHLFWHGSQHAQRCLTPSMAKSEKWAETYGGGGYGDRYYAISLTKRKKTASNFAMNSRPYIHPIILAKDAVVKDMEGKISDSYELNEIIVDLYDEGVDAIWIGGGEDELCVINPHSIVNVADAKQLYNFCYGQDGGNDSLENPSDEMLAKLLRMCKEYVEYRNANPRMVVPEKPNDRFKDLETYDYDKKLERYNKYLEDPSEIDNSNRMHNERQKEIIDALKFKQ